MTNTKALSKSAKANTIRNLLEKSKGQIAMALPKHLNADRIIRVAMTSIQRTPKLLECDPISLVGAIIQSSQLGLEPDGILGHAYLVPFRNTKMNRMEVQFIPGYKGLIDLARRSGQVVSIGSHVVYSNEKFELKFGFDETIQHEPLPPSKRGERKGVYAVARLKDGSAHFEFLWAEEVEAIKNTSKAKNFGPWKTHEEEMWRKTAIRRLVKYLPVSVELAKAAAVDELADAGVNTQEFFGDIELEATTVENKKTIDDALGEVVEPEPAVDDAAEAGNNVEKTQAEAKTEAKKESSDSQKPKKSEINDILNKIDSYGIGKGPMTAYVVRALKKNKPQEEWSQEDAEMVLAEIVKTKGVK